MKFSELDNRLRVYETAHDFCVPPNIYMVARIDGRSFTRLTKEKQNFDRPFDIKFRDLMVETVKHLMDCGFQVIYGFTESDEISLLFDLNTTVFSRKTRNRVRLPHLPSHLPRRSIAQQMPSAPCVVANTIIVIIQMISWTFRPFQVVPCEYFKLAFCINRCSLAVRVAPSL